MDLPDADIAAVLHSDEIAHEPLDASSAGTDATDTPIADVVDGPSRYEKIVAAAASKTTATGSYRVQFHTQEHPSPDAPDCESIDLQGMRTTSGETVQPRTVCVEAVHDVTRRAPRSSTRHRSGANYGSDGDQAGPGAPLADFANLVEGTLGPREGGLAMTSLASPNRYLNLTSNAITDAEPIGSGTVDGVAVQTHRVTIDINELTAAETITPDEVKAINDAIAVLRHEGYTGTVQEVSVDANGFHDDDRSVAARQCTSASVTAASANAGRPATAPTRR